jgi:pimeloyl-ACP methyl ester carboxylesterase
MKRFLAIFAATALVFLLISDAMPAEKTGDQYPFPVYHMDFYSQRQSLHMNFMYEKAQKPNGKTVLLMHGKNFSGIYWGNVMKNLLKEGYDVLAPDQVGFGTSSAPINYQYSFHQLARNTKALVDSLGIKKVILVGHSMGGMLATRFALMYPESTTQLILENPIGLEDYRQKVPYTSVDDEFKKELGKTKESVKQYFMQNYFHNEWKNEYNDLLTPITRNIDSAGFSDRCWSMALTTDMIFTQPVCNEFEKLFVPTTLIIGQLDRTAIGKDRADKLTAATMGDYPKLGRQAADRIPGGKLVEIKNSGHIPHIEEPDVFMRNLLSVIM